MSDMPNPVTALNARRRALCNRKAQLKTDYDRSVAEIVSEIADIDKAMETMRSAIEPYLCPSCGGSGNHRVPDAAGQMEDKPCRACKGTGIRIDAKP